MRVTQAPHSFRANWKSFMSEIKNSNAASVADASASALTEFPLQFTLNGASCAHVTPVSRTAADFLRDDLSMTGTRIGCSRGVCGACVALVDGTPTATCSMFAFQLNGCDVQTIEGMADKGKLHVIQQAFVDQSAFQCGYCTSGMVLLTKSLLDHNPTPSRATIIEWLSSNVCRCTGYAQIIDAVEQAAATLGAEASALGKAAA